MKSKFLTLLLILAAFAANAQCNCQIDPNEPTVCVQDSSGVFFQLPNACFAACFGYTVLPDSLCTNTGGGWGCNCSIDPNEPFICAQDSIGTYVEVPNACFAACFGLIVVSDTLCHNGGGGWTDCDCELDTLGTFICAQDSLGTYYYLPNACFAQCYGFTVVADSLCNGGGWTDCNCEIDSTEASICVQDSLGNVFQVPNACFATCWGLTVVSDTLCINNGVEPWEACDCPIDIEAPFVCAIDSLGHPCYVPNVCFAECLGLTIVSDSICSLDSVLIYQDSFILCIETLSVNNFQEFILASHNFCGMEVPQCILDAPLFNNDSLFFEYIIGNCEDITGGGNVMNIYNSFNAKALASKDEQLDRYAIKLNQNPVQSTLDFTISATKQNDVSINILDINGQIKKQINEKLSQGENQLKIDVSTINTGLYLLSIRDKDQVKTLKFVKQ